MPSKWRPASGHVKSHGDGTAHTLWRLVRDYLPNERAPFAGTFEELKQRNGRIWLTPRYETAKRKAEILNTANLEK